MFTFDPVSLNRLYELAVVELRRAGWEEPAEQPELDFEIVEQDLPTPAYDRTGASFDEEVIAKFDLRDAVLVLLIGAFRTGEQSAFAELAGQWRPIRAEAFGHPRAYQLFFHERVPQTKSNDQTFADCDGASLEGRSAAADRAAIGRWLSKLQLPSNPTSSPWRPSLQRLPARPSRALRPRNIDGRFKSAPQ
jgi:hypothetical protein